MTSTEPAAWRPIRKNTVPTASPSSDPASASPAAIRRVIRPSEPTSRSAASLRSRRSPPNRTAAAMKTATGVSRATNTTSVIRMSTGSVRSVVGCGSPNAVSRATRELFLVAFRPSAPA